jgi:hypothetical protein
LGSSAPPIVLVPIDRLDRVACRALDLAIRISPHDVQALQLLNEPDLEQQDMSRIWGEVVEAPARAAGRSPPQLVVLRPKYREFVEPVIEHARRIVAVHPDRDVAVLVAELVPRRWYDIFLHSHRATILKEALLLRGGPRLAIIDAPYYLDD